MKKGDIELVKEILYCIKGTDKKFLDIDARNQDSDLLPCKLGRYVGPRQEFSGAQGAYICLKHSAEEQVGETIEEIEASLEEAPTAKPNRRIVRYRTGSNLSTRVVI